MEMIIRMQLLLFAMAAIGAAGAVGIVQTNLSYKRMLKNRSNFAREKDKWLRLAEIRDKMLHRMNRYVWYPSLGIAACYGTARVMESVLDMREKLSSNYLYAAIGIPIMLLVFRNGLDISYREGEILEWMKEYVDHPRTSGVLDRRTRDTGKRKGRDNVIVPVREHKAASNSNNDKAEIADNIVESIRQSAAADGNYQKMMSPEEVAIMKEIIQEFL